MGLSKPARPRASRGWTDRADPARKRRSGGCDGSARLGRGDRRWAHGRRHRPGVRDSTGAADRWWRVDEVGGCRGAGADRLSAWPRRPSAASCPEQPDVILERVTVLGLDLDVLPRGPNSSSKRCRNVSRLKTTVLTRCRVRRVRPYAVLASNTSSSSITAVAALRGRRFLGMHFFNPVPPSKLVEAIPRRRPSETGWTRVRGLGAGTGKTDVVVRDSLGFATSRLGVLLGLEAIRMLEEGVADAEAITSEELGYRHPMGPLCSTDWRVSTCHGDRRVPHSHPGGAVRPATAAARQGRGGRVGS